jgi:hypothetical protein
MYPYIKFELNVYNRYRDIKEKKLDDGMTEGRNGGTRYIFVTLYAPGHFMVRA